MTDVTCPYCESPPGVMCKTPKGVERGDHQARIDADVSPEAGMRCCDLCLTYTTDTVEINVRIHGPWPAVCGDCREKLRKAG